jgi:hypothetical protein
MPCIVLPPQQSAALLLILEEIPIQGFVLPQELFAPFASLAADRLKEFYFQLVLGPQDRPTSTPLGVRVLREVHLVPGIVALFQCRALAEGREAEFHPHDRLLVEIDSHTVRVSDCDSRRPLLRVELPQRYRVREAPCACGRSLHLSLI